MYNFPFFFFLFVLKYSTASTFTSVYLVFVRVAELCVNHLYVAAFIWSHVEAELLLPGPGIRTGNLRLVQLLHHTDVMDNVQDQGLQLQLQDTGLCTETRGGEY